MPDSNITKKALARAMKELMAQKPFEKISVGALCAACGMNRKSFYYHFKDKYDLIDWIFYTEFVEALDIGCVSDGWQLLGDLCAYFYRERQFYRSALKIRGQNSFAAFFSDAITPILGVFTKGLFDGVPDTPLYTAMFSDAFLVCILHWLNDSDEITPEIFIAECHTLIVRLSHRMLDRTECKGGLHHN